MNSSIFPTHRSPQRFAINVNQLLIQFTQLLRPLDKAILKSLRIDQRKHSAESVMGGYPPKTNAQMSLKKILLGLAKRFNFHPIIGSTNYCHYRYQQYRMKAMYFAMHRARIIKTLKRFQ